MEGVLLANKPKGPTSFQIVKLLRRVTGARKIGHTGTLDPQARGLLLLVFGKATKSVERLQGLTKGYIAKILLGSSTDTDDVSGKIISQKDIAPISLERLDAILTEFEGKIKQIPPRFSAVKYKGRRAYTLARLGQEFSLKEKEVEIDNIDIIYYEHPFLRVRVDCSKGTYIRALARDIGIRLSSCATLFSLTRYRIGKWTLADSLNIDELKSKELVERNILSVPEILSGSRSRNRDNFDIEAVCIAK